MGMKTAGKIRKELKLNGNQMAETLGISRQAYHALERASTNPNLSVLLKLWEVAHDKLNWTAEGFLTQLKEELKPQKKRKDV